MESIEGLVKSPVTNLAVAGISRLVRESEADERQAALEQQRADQVAALEAQRKAAAERALGIERQIGELEAPRMVTPQAAPGEAEFQARRRLMDMGLFSEPLRADIPPTQSPFGMFQTSPEGAKAFNRAAEIAEQRDQGLPVSPEDQEFLESVVASMRSQGQKGQGAAAVLMDPVLRAQMREAMMPLTAEEAAIQKETGVGVAPAVQERLDQRAALQERLAQERQAVRDVQAQEAAVPEVEQLPRTFADYASQYQEALTAGDTAKASRLLQSVEDATDLVPKTLMEMFTGSREAKARGALLKAGAKVAEMKAKQKVDQAKAAADQMRAAASMARASAAAQNAKNLEDLRAAQAELARANAAKAREVAAKTALEVAKAKSRLGGKRSPAALNRIESSGVALDMMAMLSSGAADTDPEEFSRLRSQLESLTGKSLEGTTFITTDPSTYAPLRRYIAKRHSKVADKIVGTVEGMNRSAQAQERIAIAEGRAQLAEQKASGGAGIGELTSAIKVLRDVARDSTTPKEDKKRAREMVRYYLGRLGALTGGQTPAAQAATAASKLRKTASETQTLFEEAEDF